MNIDRSTQRGLAYEIAATWDVKKYKELLYVFEGVSSLASPATCLVVAHHVNYAVRVIGEEVFQNPHIRDTVLSKSYRQSAIVDRQVRRRYRRAATRFKRELLYTYPDVGWVNGGPFRCIADSAEHAREILSSERPKLRHAVVSEPTVEDVTGKNWLQASGYFL